MNNDLKTLFVKLKTVFPKDFYIIKGKYCIEGKLSFNKNYGSCITILENKWLEVIQSFIKENNLSMECTMIKDIDNALKKVSSAQSGIGAQSNRLAYTIMNNQNTSYNLDSAFSSLRDTDMAEEMVRYSNANILQQAGQSMLAQANQSNQGVLSLLQG